MNFYKVIEINSSGKNISIRKELLSLETFSKYYEKDKDKFVKWVAYIHYLLYPVPDQNPFYYMNDLEKETIIAQELGITGWKKPPYYDEIYKLIESVYETPLMRLLKSYKTTIDKISNYLTTTNIDDKNFRNISSFLKEYDIIREGYKKVLKDVEDEIQSMTKGKVKIGYDID